MKITKEWLDENRACPDGVEWFENQKEKDAVKVVQSLMSQDKFNWANWLIVRVMNRKQKIQYSIFASEQVIKNYEKLYPENKAPRKAIEAAKLVLENDTEENHSAACAAYSAADSAAYAACAACAADSAAYAAYSAACAACAADSAAYSAADSAACAADSAACAADSAAYSAMKTKIIECGIKILTKKK